MTDNAERLWVQDSLNRIAINNAAMAIGRQGKALPCRVTAVNGSIVTVAFEVTSEYTLVPITIPKGEGQWIRSPTQVGDLGLTVPADVYLGGISGLGGGTATMAQRANLTALVWVPVAAVSFPAVNINAAYVAGPEGAVIQTEAADSVANVKTGEITMNSGTITLTALTEINLIAAGHTLSVTSSGISIDGILFGSHVHSGVQSGGSDTGPPV